MYIYIYDIPMKIPITFSAILPLDLLDFHLTPLPLESQDPGSSSPGPTAHSALAALTALGIYGEDKKIVHFIVQYNIDSINNALLLCDHH